MYFDILDDKKDQPTLISKVISVIACAVFGIGILMICAWLDRPDTECVTTIKDGYGHSHELRGVVLQAPIKD